MAQSARRNLPPEPGYRHSAFDCLFDALRRYLFWVYPNKARQRIAVEALWRDILTDMGYADPGRPFGYTAHHHAVTSGAMLRCNRRIKLAGKILTELEYWA